MTLEFLAVISLAVGTYVVGSVPTAYLVVRSVRDEDIREVDSRNVGALNAYRQLGTWAGITVLVVDTAKGILAVAAPRWASTIGFCSSPHRRWSPVTTGRSS